MDTVRKILSISLLGALLLGVLAGVAQAAPAFPVKYSANKRYLVDQTGVPFPILGRTAWFITSLSEADYLAFIDDTAARGYNAIEFHVVNHDPRGNNPPHSGNNDLPFLKRLDGGGWGGALTYGNITNEAPDFTTTNAVYWSHVDDVLAYAESKGILVFMFPAYVGYNGGDQGWMQEMVANGPAKMQSYGAWIATRYKGQKNLVWMMGGDMGTPPRAFNSAQTSVENALLNGLKSVSGQQSIYFSAEWDSESIATDQTSFGSAMTLNGAYSWTGAVSSHGRRAYARSSVIPAFLLEEPYDEEGPDGNNVNPSAVQPVRRFQWWGWLSTIGGYISGNGYVWPFTSVWKSHLDTQGSRDMARLNAFINSIEWYKLVPSGLNGMRTLIMFGGSTVSAANYVAASATPDGRLLVAYVPPAHSGSITVDMAAMSGLTRARWFDPTSGAYSVIGTGITNSSTHDFMPPGNNSAEAKDWVLVLDVPDNTKPALKITTPTTGPALTNTTGKINLAGTATDNFAVLQVSWSDDRGGGGPATGTSSWSVPGLTLAPGQNVITVTASDAAGNSTQAVLSALYRVPPFFLQQPAAQFAATNDTVTFAVTAGGDEPLKYQWRKNGGNLIGATNDNYTITNVSAVGGGYYSVVVANVAGSATSSNALLKVFVPPLITSHPLGRAVTVGGKVSFKVKATGTAPLFYQWRQDGEAIPGATNRSVALYNVPTNRAGLYSVVVSNFAGVRVSSNALLTVNVPPAFTQQPVAQSAVAGPTNILFEAFATGTEPLKYQWRKNGGNIAGATNVSYTVTNVTASSLYYSVVVANVAGTVVSSNALLKVFVPPVLTSQPGNRTVTAGGATSFSVTASGTAPLFYQWRKDEAEVGGATNRTLSLANLQTNQGGGYRVVVSNFAGVRVTTNAVLTVTVPLVVSRLAEPVVSPFLNAAIADGALILSWSTNAGDFTLESSTDLSHWSPLPPPGVADDACVVTNFINGPARFYRLVK